MNFSVKQREWHDRNFSDRNYKPPAPAVLCDVCNLKRPPQTVSPGKRKRMICSICRGKGSR